jgi:hypothetical protein
MTPYALRFLCSGSDTSKIGVDADTHTTLVPQCNTEIIAETMQELAKANVLPPDMNFALEEQSAIAALVIYVKTTTKSKHCVCVCESIAD